MSQHAWQLLLFLQVYVKHLVNGRKIDETLIAEFFSLFYRNSIGFALNLDGRSCVDVDECKENPRICNGGKCTNIEGGYICTCTDGLIPGKDGASCIGKSDRDLDKNLSFKNPRGWKKKKLSSAKIPGNYSDLSQTSTSATRSPIYAATANATTRLGRTIVVARKVIR